LPTAGQAAAKQPAIRHLLAATIDGKRGFPSLIVKIVERGITYRKNKNPLLREDIEHLNELLVRVGYIVPDLHDAAFLDRLPRAASSRAAETAAPPIDAKALADLQDRLLKLAMLKGQERGYALKDSSLIYSRSTSSRRAALSA
jgi:hypothetical protein